MPNAIVNAAACALCAIVAASIGGSGATRPAPDLSVIIPI